VEEGGPAGGPSLHEGRDFTSAEELREQVGDEAPRTVPRSASERLAEAVAREVRWLHLTGETPGGLPWDRQPAWRVRLWEHFVDERARVAALAAALATW
jgi:hypothetical protein